MEKYQQLDGAAKFENRQAHSLAVLTEAGCAGET